MADLLFRTIGSLAFIALLMIGVGWVAKKYLLPGKAFGSSGSGIDVIAHIPLQPKRSIFLVRVPGKILVVGSAENGLTKLSEISDVQALEKFELSVAEASKSGQRFADIFKRFLHTN